MEREMEEKGKTSPLELGLELERVADELDVRKHRRHEGAVLNSISSVRAVPKWKSVTKRRVVVHVRSVRETNEGDGRFDGESRKKEREPNPNQGLVTDGLEQNLAREWVREEDVTHRTIRKCKTGGAS